MQPVANQRAMFCVVCSLCVFLQCQAATLSVRIC